MLPEGIYSVMDYAMFNLMGGISVPGSLGILAFAALWLSTRAIVPELQIKALAICRGHCLPCGWLCSVLSPSPNFESLRFSLSSNGLKTMQ